VQPVKIRTGNHLNRLHEFEGSINQWPLMRCILTESRVDQIFFCLSVKCEASFTVCQLPKSLTATNWPILRDLRQYVHCQYSCSYTTFTCLSECSENRIPEVQNFKISRGSMPPDPPRYSHLRRAFISWRTLSFKLTVSTIYRSSCFPVSKCLKKIRRPKRTDL